MQQAEFKRGEDGGLLTAERIPSFNWTRQFLTISLI
jgi:hypothetical protein